MFLKLIHETNQNISTMFSKLFFTGTLLIMSASRVFFLCSSLMAPDWKISVMSCSSPQNPLVPIRFSTVIGSRDKKHITA